MTFPTRISLALAGCAIVLATSAFVPADGETPPTKKLVLVELFTSQGCDMCPAAEKMLAGLATDERVVPITFHVDYFNNPWVDPFSDPLFSRREMQYSLLYDKANKLNKPDYLYLTPLVMVDGQVPMVGKDDAATRARAIDGIRRSLAEKPSVSIDLAFRSNKGAATRSLEVSLAGLTNSLKGREVLVAVVPFAAQTTTKVGSGELAGRTYSGRFIARGFDVRAVSLPRSGKTLESFAITLPKGVDTDKDGVVVIVQDEETGKVFQAAKIPWKVEGEVKRTGPTPRRRG